MDLELLLIADYANVDREEKLNIMGIFNNVRAPDFPVRHPELQLVIQLVATAGEAGDTRSLSVKLIDEDGVEVLRPWTKPFTVPPYRGQPIEVNQILRIRDIVFPKEGTYEFRILVDNDDKGGKTFTVAKVDANA